MLTRIGRFAAGAAVGNLAARDLMKRNILDSLGCAVAAQSGEPFQALRDQIAEYRAPGRCTLIGGGTTSPDQAAFYNAALVRYVDLLDSYMSPGGLCHPSDNFGAVLAAAEYVDASMEDFVVALAVAYEVQCRITACVPVMARGFNHAIQLAVSAAAAAGKLFGLAPAAISEAMAIAAVDNISLACVHAEPVSQWKGFSPAMTTMRSVYAASLARRGFTGPQNLFEGPNGLERMLGQKIEIDWEDKSLRAVEMTYLKKYCSLIHGQPALEAVLHLKRGHGIEARDVEAVSCDIFQMGFEIAGGGVFGPKDDPRTKEQADYNLKYLIAAALLDGQVGPAQLETGRVRAPDVQRLLARVSVRPDDELTKTYPDELAARVSIRMRDGRESSELRRDYEGSPSRPLTWERSLEKFNWLAEPFADGHLRSAIAGVVARCGREPVRSLTALLAQVRRAPAYLATHPGVQ